MHILPFKFPKSFKVDIGDNVLFLILTDKAGFLQIQKKCGTGNPSGNGVAYGGRGDG